MAGANDRPGAGLPPLSGAMRPEDALNEQERQCLTEPMRAYQASLAKRGNEPGRRAGEEFIRLAALGLLKLEQLRQANDGIVDIDVDGPHQFKVTR